MTDLVEVSQWEPGVYQLETNDPVEGGLNGIDNQQAKQLGNRTTWLKAVLDQVITAAGLAPDAADLSQLLAAIQGGVGLAKDYSSAGYQVFPGGLILQWGTSTGIVSGGSGAVTFPIAFPAVVRKIQVTGRSSTFTSSLSGFISGETATGFTLGSYSGNSLTRSYDWIALGY